MSESGTSHTILKGNYYLVYDEMDRTLGNDLTDAVYQNTDRLVGEVLDSTVGFGVETELRILLRDEED